MNTLTKKALNHSLEQLEKIDTGKIQLCFMDAIRGIDLGIEECAALTTNFSKTLIDSVTSNLAESKDWLKAVIEDMEPS